MNAPSPTYADTESLQRVYAELMTGVPIVDLTEAEHWTNLIHRISVPGHINRINEETFFYFLEVLPPRLLGSNRFAFAEGQQPLRIFWQHHAQFYCRQLDWAETYRLCDASGLPRDYGFY